MKLSRELLARFDVPGPTRFREISVRNQTSQEFAIEVNDRVTGFLKEGLESQRQGGFTRARLSGEPVNHRSQILRLIHRPASAFDGQLSTNLFLFSRSTTAGFPVHKSLWERRNELRGRP